MDCEPADDARRRLQIYISDHQAGAAAGRALARRCAANNAGTVLGADMQALAVELDRDASVLRAVADALAIRESRLKSTIARLGERLGRLKPNGQLLGYSPLSRLLELELLITGIRTKRSLWRALRAARLPALRTFDLNRLEERAVAQEAFVMKHHETAAQHAFAGAGPATDAELAGAIAGASRRGSARQAP